MTPSREWDWIEDSPDAHAYPPYPRWDPYAGERAFNFHYQRPRATTEHVDYLSTVSASAATVSIHVGTYNALSLRDEATAEVTAQRRRLRMEELHHQMRELHIVGLQETRTRMRTYDTDHFHVIASGHDHYHYGCETWLNLRKPYGKDAKGRELYFKPHHVRVLATHPRHLVVKIQAPGMVLTLASYHATHQQSSAEDACDFWSRADSLTARWTPDVIMIDANGRLGSIQSCAVSTEGYSQEEDRGGARFHTFLLDHDMLMIPHDDSGVTWTSSADFHHRIDYVATTAELAAATTKAYTMSDIDKQHDGDHYPACLHLCFTATASSNKLPKTLRLDRRLLRSSDSQSAFASALSALPLQPWEMEANDHNHEVAEQIRQAAKTAFQTQDKPIFKPYIQRSTYSLINIRRQVRRVLRYAKGHAPRQTALDLSRQLAKRLVHGDLADLCRTAGANIWHPTVVALQISAQSLLHTHIDVHEWLLNLTRFISDTKHILRKALDSDLTRFLVDIAKGVTTDFDDHQSFNAWTKLKKLLKWGGRKSRVTRALPMRITSDGQVIPNATDQAEHDLKHFGDVEKARYCTQEQLVHTYNLAQRADPRTCEPMLVNTPSRADLARLFRHAARGRSAGPDIILDDLMAAAPAEMSRMLHPLMTKMSFRQVEPLALKGAYLTPFPKNGIQTAHVKGERAIFLSNTIAKTHHRFLRSLTTKLFDMLMHSTQYGGRPHRSTDMSVHTTLSALAYAKSLHRSTALPMLKSASGLLFCAA